MHIGSVTGIFIAVAIGATVSGLAGAESAENLASLRQRADREMF